MGINTEGSLNQDLRFSMMSSKLINSDIAPSQRNAFADSVAGKAAAFTGTTAEFGSFLDNEILSFGSGEEGGLSKFFGNSELMSGLAGLGQVGLQALALPTMLKNAKLQNKSLKFNLNTAKAEQARRNTNIASFNNFGNASSAPAPTNIPKSAFLGG
jgi:hypothetical protein